MESKYKELSLFEFSARFSSDEICLSYLAEEKWKNGYCCKKCGHTRYCAGKTLYSRQCTSCHYTESPTAGTLFHKLKFSLLKAFYIVYFVSTNKKGISSTELSRKLSLQQRTCWLFKRKVMRAMKSSGEHPLTGAVDVDEFFVGGIEQGKRGRGKDKKKLVVLGIEKRGRGVSRFYGRVIESADSKNLGSFMRENIDKKAEVTTDKWAGYKPLLKEYEKMKQIPSGKKGENFKELHRVIMLFKSWLRGIYHSVRHLQAYIDEYAYRFNRSFMKGNIFENLLIRMINDKPCFRYDIK